MVQVYRNFEAMSDTIGVCTFLELNQLFKYEYYDRTLIDKGSYRFALIRFKSSFVAFSVFYVNEHGYTLYDT